MLGAIKILFLSLYVTLFSYSAHATLKNGSEGASVPACSTTGNMISADQGSCRTTPSKYLIIFLKWDYVLLILLLVMELKPI